MQAHAALLRRHSQSTTPAVARALAGSTMVSSDQRRIRPYSCCSSPLTSSSLLKTSLHASSSLLRPSSSRFIGDNGALRRSYYTLPSSAACAATYQATNDDIPKRTSSLLSSCCIQLNNHNHTSNNNATTTTTIQKRHKVFVSKHNQTLNLTPQQITDYLCQQLPHLSTNNSDHFRITSTHVVIKECPFCSKPTNHKPDNMYKCYVKLGGGAYFCHRCGAKGSWYDLKSELGGFSVENTGQGGNHGHQHVHRNSGNANNNGNAQQYQQQQPQRATKPLPMPHTKLNSLHSSRLFDPRNSSTHNIPEYKTMQYLQHTRGLTRSVLRKYGVGCAEYKFPSKKKGKGGNGGGMEYVSSTCVTFPWLMRQGEVQEQEELRGAQYVWRKDDEDEDEDSEDEEHDKEKERTRELERESKRRIEAAAAEAAFKKKKSKARSEMTALERYYAKRERRSASSRNKKSAANNNEDEKTEDNNITEQFQFTPQTPQPKLPEPLTTDEIESLHGPYITRRIKVRSIEQKSWQRLDPPGGGFGLFGWHTIPHDTNEIIITEGEFDAMAVYQATGRPAVSLPNGCRSLPMEVLVLLERFDTVYLWMDNDGPGREGAEMFARKLGVERCLLVQPSGKRGWNGRNNQNNMMMDEGESSDDDEELSFEAASESRPPPPKDANEALLQGWDINELLNEASELPHERILKFSDLRDQVIHEITNPDKYRGVPVPSLPGFTSLIKGFRRGEMTVLTGPTGSGKTTFLGQASLDLAEQGVNVLWGSFEIKNTRLMHKLLQQYMKDVLPIGLAEREGSMEEKKKMYEALTVLADKFDTLPMYFMKFHGGSDIDDVLDAMEYAAYVHDVEHIILDNMQFMISRDVKKMSSSFDKFDMQDIAIEKFRKFATDYNVHVTLVVHPRKEDEGAKLGISSFYGSAKATQEADTVLILQSDGKRKFVDVKKNRFDGTLGHVPLYFERKSGRYTEDAPAQAPPKTVVPNGVGVKTFNGVGHQKGRAVASSNYGDIRGQHPL
eukprot:scaffold2701_cov137-Skeletonema_dohrnii-CCMP3373.AAC.5